MDLFFSRIQAFFSKNKKLFKESPYYRRQLFSTIFLLVVLFAVFAYSFFIGPPRDFNKSGKLFTISSGETLTGIANDLVKNSIISNPICVKVFATFLGQRRGSKAGDYYFPEPVSCFSVAARIVHGDYGLFPVKVTLVEGLNSREIAKFLLNKFPSFDEAGFIKLANEKEGFLFPDTYFFFPNIKPEDVTTALENNFQVKIAPLEGEIKKSGRSLSEIITMASIVEDEAKTTEDRKIVAGILWKRIKLGMPLQVDAPFRYLDGKGTFDLTTSDLATSSPYNTYTHKGLPPTPIGNPGLDSILAALRPEKTNYLYFVSNKKGVIHYATTFEEHQTNRELYLGR